MFLSVNFKNSSRTLFYVEHFQGTATKGNWKLMGARRGSIIWKWERKTGAKRCSWTVCFYQTEKPSYIQKWIYSFMGNHICYNIFSLRALIFCSYLSGIYLRHQTVIKQTMFQSNFFIFQCPLHKVMNYYSFNYNSLYSSLFWWTSSEDLIV